MSVLASEAHHSRGRLRVVSAVWTCAWVLLFPAVERMNLAVTGDAAQEIALTHLVTELIDEMAEMQRMYVNCWLAGL